MWSVLKHVHTTRSETEGKRASRNTSSLALCYSWALAVGAVCARTRACGRAHTIGACGLACMHAAGLMNNVISDAAELARGRARTLQSWPVRKRMCPSSGAVRIACGQAWIVRGNHKWPRS